MSLSSAFQVWIEDALHECSAYVATYLQDIQTDLLGVYLLVYAL
ncbi:MAG: hypothetical protein QXI19_06240 [Candidatus Caldarchaeum sp.]